MVRLRAISFGIVFVIAGVTGATFNSDAGTPSSLEAGARSLAADTHLEYSRTSIRLAHAKELLGKGYQRSVVKAGENIGGIEPLITEWVTKSLSAPWKYQARDIARALIQESDKYKFDPIFLMAVIGNESSFNPIAIGTSGEVGLMQILPPTAEWISKKNNLPWMGADSLKDPVTNIRIGAAYLAHLRERYNCKSMLYLAAYNMGCTNVKRALQRQTMPRVYSNRVMRHYLRFYGQIVDDTKKAL